ncbi:MAG: alpha/beta fold hydrolase [Propionibacteriales bacterium]|nr:alpha/beta fold hydrolase [Propionibacteriales bacterium]
MQEPRLTRFHWPDAPRGIVLLLHGGQKNSSEPVGSRNASWLRMAFIARAFRSMARRNDLAVVLLRYRKRGWNNQNAPDPVAGARWALDVLRDEHRGAPIVLVGHSMGGRTACRVADDEAVAGVCALAPWLPEGEPVDALTGRSLHVLHGTRDRWTSARWSRDFVERCRPIATSAAWRSMPGVGHFMLRRVGEWNQFVTDSGSLILGLTTSTEAANKGTE